MNRRGIAADKRIGDDIVPAETVTADGNAYAPKTFTADDGLFDSGQVQPGNDYRYAFDGPVTIAFHCEIHPSMTGSVTVSAAD